MRDKLIACFLQAVVDTSDLELVRYFAKNVMYLKL